MSLKTVRPVYGEGLPHPGHGGTQSSMNLSETTDRIDGDSTGRVSMLAMPMQFVLQSWAAATHCTPAWLFV